MAGYRIVTLGNQVGMGTAGARYAQLWARAKANSAVSPYCVPNELICTELGRALRLPVAPGAIIATPKGEPKAWFASLDFSREGEALPDVDPEECVRLKPDLCAGIVLFDIFIANGDRTVRNLSLDQSEDSSEVRLFDHELALLGATAGQAEGRLDGLRNAPGIPEHCLRPYFSTDQLRESQWLERIAELPDYFIREVCREAARYGMTTLEVNTAIDFLLRRRHNVQYLL